MKLGRRKTLILGGVALAAAASGIALHRHRATRSADPADAFWRASFPDQTGKLRRIVEWHGSILVCNFWATWCAPCREEIPILMEVRRKHLASGVEMIGIAIDQAANVAEYAANMKISYPLLVADAIGLELMRGLGNKSGGLPYTAFFDRSGALAHRKLGPLALPELEDTLQRLLRG